MLARTSARQLLARLPVLGACNTQRLYNLPHAYALCTANISSFNSSEQSRIDVASRAVVGIALMGFAASQLKPADAEEKKEEETVVDPYQRPSEARGLPKRITLYQYEVCPYCCKVKAFLDYHKLPYHVVEVNPLTKAELKWSSYKKVPQVQFDDGQVLRDSTLIISTLAREVEETQREKNRQEPTVVVETPVKKGWLSKPVAPSPAPASVPPKTMSEEEERRWRKWVDEKLVLLITANVYRSWSESFQMFTYITEQTNWSWGTRELARVFGGVLMWVIGKRMPKKYDIKGNIRYALFDAIEEFCDALGDKKFMGGDKPNLADLAVFGVMKAVVKTDTFHEVMHVHTRLVLWWMRMQDAVGEDARVRDKAPVAAAA